MIGFGGSENRADIEYLKRIAAHLWVIKWTFLVSIPVLIFFGSEVLRMLHNLLRFS